MIVNDITCYSVLNRRARGMTKLVVGDRLREAVEQQTFIRRGDPGSVEGAKYDFHLGRRLLKAKFGRSVDMKEIPAADLFVEPGEMVFVFSEESLALPNNMACVLSPKRKLSHLGVLVLGGFFIDPLYEGELLVGLYNFSSTSFPLIAGKKLIAAVFYELEPVEMGGDFKAPVAMHDFPDELVQMMRGYSPITAAAIQEHLRATEKELACLRDEFRSHEGWQQRFRESLDRHDGQIEKLLGGLAEEKENRISAEREFRKDLKEIHKDVTRVALRLAALVAGITIVAAAFIQYLLPKILGNP